MTVASRELLRRLPKAELHCHLDGSLRTATMLELGREYGVEMPRNEPEALADYMLVADARHLEDYLDRFRITLSVMQRPEALERITYELMVDAAADGVRYIEIRYSPVLNTAEGMTLEQAVEAPLRGIDRAQRELAIVGRLIICAIRSMPPAVSRQLAELAVAYRPHGVVAFDLAGGEFGNPAAAHADAFAYARAHDLPCTVHAGEGDGPMSVREAVHVCGASRLGHAVRLIEDPSLTQYVNDRRIGLEICLTSNVQTRAVPSYAAHPLRRYFEEGQEVTLNTDNRLMSGVTLTDEYAAAAEHLGFTFEELGLVAVNGFRAAFLPWQARLALMQAARHEIGGLQALAQAEAREGGRGGA